MSTRHDGRAKFCQRALWRWERDGLSRGTALGLELVNKENKETQMSTYLKYGGIYKSEAGVVYIHVWA